MRNKLIIMLVILGAVVPIALSYAQETAMLQTESQGRITIDFKDADIGTVLKVISLKSGMNIVAGKDVSGSVTVRLFDVPWQTALDTIMSTSDLSYERVGSVIIVNSVRRMTEQKKAQKELFASQSFVSEVFTLKFLNAVDVMNVVEPMLTRDEKGMKKGMAQVLYTTGQKGWAFGVGVGQMTSSDSTSTAQTTTTAATQQGTEGKKVTVSKTLLVVDIPPVIERIRHTLDVIDIKPKQVLIETRIVEVRRDLLRDLGLDVSTGTVSPTSFQFNPIKRRGEKGAFTTVQEIGTNGLTSFAAPAAFNPLSTGITGTPTTGTDVFSTGLNFAYKKLMGFEFEVVMHALEENVDANILSAPRLLTLNNQEASILIGSKYPILSGQTTASGGTATATAELDYYQDVGIQLKVVPQINADGYVNMIVHPVISTITGYVSAGVISAGTGAVPIQYPILQTREAETQVLMKDGETVVIGGLLRDQKVNGTQGIPFLKDIPILGWPFSRHTTDTEKIDLLIFITARIIDDNKLEEREKLKFEEFQSYDKQLSKESAKEEKKRKKIEEREAKKQARTEARKKKAQPQ